ncbi:Protein-lysine N-methyltransferase efm6 [Lithohypha guttulata]|nr:Protein-lysine N-methyltransferase efm6 [Lithohypha guttulata]
MNSRSSSPENDVFALGIVPERQNKAAGTTSTDFDGLLPKPLLLHEDLKEGCGGQLWPAGVTLAKYMLTYHRDLRSKSILEIGAGGGLVGLAVASGCLVDNDKKLLVTDQIPMLSLMQKNVALNALDAKSGADSSHCPDVVLAADCVYFEPAFPLLLQTLQDLIGPSTVCYFCFKKRRKADMRFIRDMNKTFKVEEVEYDDRDQDRQASVFLHKLTARDV